MRLRLTVGSENSDIRVTDAAGRLIAVVDAVTGRRVGEAYRGPATRPSRGDLWPLRRVK